MILSTLSAVPGYIATEHFGIVSGSTVRSRQSFRDVLSDIKTVFGGEIKGYTEMMNLARDEALQRMQDHARGLGANAVLSIRIASGAAVRSGAEVYAYGTAVRLEPMSAGRAEVEGL